MTLTNDMIDSLRFAGRMVIDAELEAELLQQLGVEPHPETYSEQDLYEQVRKRIHRSIREKKIVTQDF